MELYDKKGAEEGALFVVSIPDELAQIVISWRHLSKPVRQAVQALVSTGHNASAERPAPNLSPTALFDRHLTL